MTGRKAKSNRLKICGESGVLRLLEGRPRIVDVEIHRLLVLLVHSQPANRVGLLSHFEFQNSPNGLRRPHVACVDKFAYFVDRARRLSRARSMLANVNGRAIVPLILILK